MSDMNNKPIFEGEKYPSDKSVIRVYDDKVYKQNTEDTARITSESE